jgi:tetratricopeptide (TPR) repeat protein
MHISFNLNIGKNLAMICLRVIQGGLILALLSPWRLLADSSDYADQLSHARLFSQPLTWVGANPPSADETFAVYQAAGLDASSPSPDVIGALDAFIKSHPDSAWTASLEANLAKYYRSLGRYAEALDYWQKAWQSTKDGSDARSRMVADFTIAYWTQLLSSLGRVQELSELITTANGRQWSRPEYQKEFNLARQSLDVMRQDPGVSYRCGTLALYNVAGALGVNSEYKSLLDLDSPATGFSMPQLLSLSKQYHLGLTAVKRPAGNQLVVPSVVHWKECHYAAIVGKRNGAYKVIDPTFGRPQWLTAEAINENASGYFLVPTNSVPADWTTVSSPEIKPFLAKELITAPIQPRPAPIVSTAIL